MSVPTNNQKVNCITTYQEYDIYHPVSGMMPSMSIGIDGIFHSLDRIASIYQCNIIHEISHSYCSVACQGLTFQMNIPNRYFRDKAVGFEREIPI